MIALAPFDTDDLRPVLHPAVYVEPKDRLPTSEDDRQAEFVAWMRQHVRACRVVAIPNAGRRTRWEAAKRKREGMAAGEPDLCVSWADGGARIEFKAARTMPDENQVETLNWYHCRGHAVAVCRTAAGAIEWLASIGAPVPRDSFRSFGEVAAGVVARVARGQRA